MISLNSLKDELILDSVGAVLKRCMRTKVQAILSNTMHPLHDTFHRSEEQWKHSAPFAALLDRAVQEVFCPSSSYIVL